MIQIGIDIGITVILWWRRWWWWWWRWWTFLPLKVCMRSGRAAPLPPISLGLETWLYFAPSLQCATNLDNIIPLARNKKETLCTQSLTFTAHVYCNPRSSLSHRKSRPAPDCRVLLPEKFNVTISQPLLTHSDSFMTLMMIILCSFVC